MASTYITLEELRTRLTLPQGDDTGLLAAISAAEAAINRYCSAPRGLASLEVTEVQRGRGLARHFPLRPMITAVGACTIAGATVGVELWDEQSIIRTDGGLFTDGARISLTYTAGHTVIPDDLKQAAALTAMAFYTAPAFEPNLQNQSLDGVMAGSVHQRGLGAIPPGAVTLLEPLRWVVPF